MLLFIPIQTNAPVRRVPYVNYALIGLNVLAYLVTDLFGGSVGQDLKFRLMLRPADMALYQFVGYQFLHADLLHLLGNMLFLWVFGNSVNSKMGHWAYLCFYMAAGVFAGLGFVVNGDAPLIGASGAIAGVTTAYLVLFPHSEVNLFYWIWFYIGSTHVRAMLLIVIKIIIWDNVLAPNLVQHQGVNNVAYSAHIAGYVFGFVLCFLLLLIRALPRDQYDILALARRSYQRQQYKAMMADPNAQAQARFGRVASPVSVFTGRPVDATAMAADEEIVRMRTDISNAIARGDYAAAVNEYERLVARDPRQVLSRKNMLAVANQLMAMGRYPQAAAAYEKHLAAYPAADDRLQIKFLLGVIYAKYLQQNEPAEKLFRDCASNMTDPNQREQASQWLAAVASALGGGPATSEA